MLYKIYKIVSKNTDKIYVGSTQKMLSKRLRGHVNGYKLYLRGKSHFISAFDIIKLGDYSIKLLEQFECDTKCEALAREGFYMEKHKDIIINKYIAGRSMKQWREDNKEKIKKYRDDNREQLNSKKRQVCKCICGKSYTHTNKKRHCRTKQHTKFVAREDFLKFANAVVASFRSYPFLRF